MADETIVAELILDDGKYTVRMDRASKAAKAFERDMLRLNSRMDLTAKASRSASLSLMKWTVIIGQARNALHQIWAVTGQWTQSLIKTSAEIERITLMLKGMSKAADETGRLKEAKSDVDALFKSARNAPFSMNALTDSFVKFKSVGMDPLDGSLGALTDAVAAFGGTDDVLKRASIAIQQMAGKGVISMEELRQQLGEAVPQAITIMAQSMGKSYGELVDQISKGNVAAKPALDAMLNGMKLVYGGRAQLLMKSYNGSIAQMKTAWTELVAKSPGIQSFFQNQKELIQQVTRTLNSATFKAFANEVGEYLASAIGQVRDIVAGFTLAYGKTQAFYNVLRSATLDKSSFVGMLASALEEVIKLLGTAYNGFMKMYKAIVLASGGMTEEEFDEKVLKERIKNRSEFAAEEYETLSKLQDKNAKDLIKKRKKLNEDMAALNDGLSLFTKSMGENGELLIKEEQLKQVSRRYTEVSAELKALNEEAARRKTTLNAARREYDLLKTDGSSDQKSKAGIDLTSAISSFAEADSRAAAAQAKFDGLKQSIITTAQAYDISVGDSLNKFEPIYDSFGDAVNITESQLDSLASSSNSLLSSTAQAVIDLKREIEDMADLDVDVGNVMFNEFEEAVEEAMSGGRDALLDFQNQMASEAGDMMAEVQSVMTDETMDGDAARISAATDVINQYRTIQAEALEKILAASLAAINQETEEGVAAALRLAEVANSILASLNSELNVSTANLGKDYSVPGSKSGGKSGGKSKGTRAGERLEDMIEEANRAGEELSKRFADPFAYELPSAIDSARKKIDKLANDISGGLWTQQMQGLFDTIATNEMTEEMIKMGEATRDIERSLMGEGNARKETYEEEVRRIKQMKAKLIEMGIWRVEWEGTVQDQLMALQEQYAAASPMGEFMNEWKNLYDDLEQVGADTMGSLAQGMADMVTEGKVNFADLARSAVNSLLKISFNAGISGLADILGSAFKTGFGGLGGGSGMSTGSIGSGKIYHSGDIVGQSGRGTQIDMAMFSNAQRYHTGGVIGQEVPAILEKGEGVFTAAQMKALGGNTSSSRETKVNIINNTGTEVESDESNAKFSPDGMVLDIVLKRVQQPGPFRDSMKRALK